MPNHIPLSQPDLGDAEISAVVDVLRSGRLSIGPQQEAFEHAVARRSGRMHGVAVNSGTAGLHLALLALGIGPGDEVITTPFSFVASANVILMVGATPVFVDVCPRSLNLEPAGVEAAVTERTRAILAVEVFGNTTHMAALEAVARKHEIPLVEDCCEALGGRDATGRDAGGFGRVGVYGFYPNKQVTTGEGGMIVTDDDQLADLCRSLRNQGRAVNAHSGLAGRIGSWLTHERLGFNCRLSEIAAALGVVQMQRLDEMLEKRRRVAGWYTQHLMDAPELVLPQPEPGSEGQHSWFVYVVRLSSGFGPAERDAVIDGLRKHDIGASNYFPCIHLQPFYREVLGDLSGRFPVAERASGKTIALPFFPDLDETRVELVCRRLRDLIAAEGLRRA
ncbi:DegT/DnrJ/EryC1/StrS family aminotransferase [Phycisphaera mikurensis]|uniref:Putative aminotransferase n=1 Tax=Phycisphaera mikurensis (strain NBRC 102666 / KCTC 22515 / FYK2301M01) TaxID=1142394 RepID=I0IGJ0_PHYMF|nr:DegT/DnrJ/EryC1/StrS family aminotransferase [Phycisphaera mikurensis]MBB6442940.1 perosamine synthetase [Phycisphaera mikurensis]BAM04378.1 putative aminotransferase [Phycisphaera mikurensis NBRC 102666]